MQSIRTRLARITATSALVLALGASLAAGPAAAADSPEAGSAPIATAPGAPAPEGTDALAGSWVVIRTYSSETACLGGGVGLIARPGSPYDDFQCLYSPRLWYLIAHRP